MDNPAKWEAKAWNQRAGRCCLPAFPGCPVFPGGGREGGKTVWVGEHQGWWVILPSPASILPLTFSWNLISGHQAGEQWPNEKGNSCQPTWVPVCCVLKLGAKVRFGGIICEPQLSWL